MTKAVLLVGGEATRLVPLTCNIPKAMVPVVNTPFLEHVISYLSSHQIREMVLAQRWLSQHIEGYFSDGSRFGVEFTSKIEDVPLGTAGAVKNVERYLDETFLMLNGDIFTDLDITAMINFHLAKKAKVTIALTPVEDPTSYGLVETNDQGRVTRFLEKPGWNEVTTNMINAGLYIIEPEVLMNIPPQVKVSIERETFPLLLAQGEPIYAYPSDAYWIDIGTPQKYLQLNQDLLSGKSRHYALSSGEEVQIGEQSHVHHTVQLKGPVVIGNNCTIGRGVKLIGPVVIGSSCTILEDTVIEESVIWWNTELGPHVNLKNSIVADNCRLNANCIVEGSVLGDNITVVSGSRLEPGSKIWPGTTVEPE